MKKILSITLIGLVLILTGCNSLNGEMKTEQGGCSINGRCEKPILYKLTNNSPDKRFKFTIKLTKTYTGGRTEEEFLYEKLNPGESEEFCGCDKWDEHFETYYEEMKDEYGELYYVSYEVVGELEEK